MYKFVGLNEKGTFSTFLSIQTIFNGINLDQALTDEAGTFTTLTVSGRANVTQRIDTAEVPGRDGLVEDEETTIAERNITIKYRLTDNTNEGFRDRYNRLNHLLRGSKKALSFNDEEAIFYATLQSNEVPEEESNSIVGTISFLCSDPNKYGPEKTVKLETVLGNIVEVEGTAPTKPVFELDVLAPITFAMVSTGDEYMVIGKPSDVTEEEVDTRTNVLHEEGDTLNSWSTTPVQVDENFSDIDGVMAYDGSGIYVEDFGAGNKMHGPAMTKEITPVQDFELETIFDVITDDNEENFRMEIYMFDENFNMLGKVGINDNSRYLKRIRGLARVGEYVDRDTRYAIGSSNYERELGDVSLMFFRVKRVGNKYTFYVSQIVNGDHQDTLIATYTDEEGAYLGRLKYVEIFIGKWQDRQRPFRARINNINVWQLAPTTVDQTPYIARIGDKITIDNQNKKLLLNGEPVVKGDFGARPFSLKPGENKVVLLPENAVQGVMKYNPAYK